jgi:hypothetical protein
MAEALFHSLLLLAGMFLITLCTNSSDSDSDSENVDAGIVSYNYILGTQTFAPSYQFTEENKIIETAKAIREMGSNIIKTSARGDESTREILDMPFTYYFLWYRSQNRAWKDGFSESAKQEEYEETYKFTKHLLTRYSGTNKTFFLGHWEGDWYLIPSYKTDMDAPDTAIQGMIDWLNTRQKAVDDAKRDVTHDRVQVYVYTEVNRVRDAMNGLKRLANSVLPHTNVDYVSYSAYDMQHLSQEEVNRTLDYVESMLPHKPRLMRKRVFIGEFGIRARSVDYDEVEHERKNREIILKFLKWGCPFILYWEIYNNEVKNGVQEGYWLINDKNEKQPLYFTLHNLYKNSSIYVTDFLQANGRMPTIGEYQEWAVEWLTL